jgi:hypothetical protein
MRTKNYYNYKNSSNEDIQLSDFNSEYHNGSNVINKTFNVNLRKNIEFGTNIAHYNCLPKELILRHIIREQLLFNKLVIKTIVESFDTILMYNV